MMVCVLYISSDNVNNSKGLYSRTGGITAYGSE